MRITRWAEYGIHCCLYLAKKYAGKPVGAAEIAKAQAIPLQYTQQILQRLRKGGIIKSVRGPRGGYRLSRSPSEIDLKQILDSVEGATFEVMCENDPVYPQMCSDQISCALRMVWEDLRDAIDQYLSKRTLADLLQLQHDASRQQSGGLVNIPQQKKRA